MANIPSDKILELLIKLKEDLPAKPLNTIDIRKALLKKYKTYYDIHIAYSAKWITYQSVSGLKINGVRERYLRPIENSSGISLYSLLSFGIRHGFIIKERISQILPDVYNRGRTEWNCIYKYQII